MIDFHTHILPGIDDGPKNAETAQRMLEETCAAGIGTVVSTSHIYIEEERDIDVFLHKRGEAYAKLAVSDGALQIRLGAEVHLKPHVGDYDSVQRLAIEGTDYILLEMPYSGWNNELYEAIYNIQTLGLKPIMAHIERFLRYRSEFEQLKSLDVIFQVNADSFMHRPMRREMLKLFDEGYVHLLGSDMHNMTSRPNNLVRAREIIEKSFGAEFLRILDENAEAVLGNGSVSKKKYPKLGFFDRFRL